MDNLQQFGEWTVQDTLKHRRCYIVTREEDDRRYALKVHDENKDGTIFNEVKVMERLAGHPNILSLVDYDLDYSIPYHVTPFYEGGPLSNATFSGWPLEGLHYNNITYFLGQLAKAVGYMHSQGVTHGTLIRHNIVVTKYNIPVIIDFETAKIFDDFPDTEEDLSCFAQLYCKVMKSANEHRIRKRKEQAQKE